MPTIVVEETAAAPVDRVFDLARDVERHTDTVPGEEEAVGGTTTGRLELGDTVTWRARHFGLPFELTAEITAMDAPRHFRDEQVDGPFARMVHDHYFEPTGDGGTRTRDEFHFVSPAGPLGTLVDAVVLERYMRRFLRERARSLAAVAEAE